MKFSSLRVLDCSCTILCVSRSSKRLSNGRNDPKTVVDGEVIEFIKGSGCIFCDLDINHPAGKICPLTQSQQRRARERAKSLKNRPKPQMYD